MKQSHSLSVLLALSTLVGPIAGAEVNPAAPQGGTFYTNLDAEPTTLNPFASTDGYATDVQGYVLEQLLDRNPDTYDWIPALATKWEIAKDKKTFTFTLRPGATFSDGKPVTAEDVKFSFDVIVDPKMPTAHLRPYFDGIKSVEIVDPQTVKFIAKDTYFGNFETAATLTIVQKSLYLPKPDDTKLNRVLIGSGPYMLEKYEKGKRIVLTRNPKWWGLQNPEQKGVYNVDKISFRFVGEKNVAFEMLKKGDVDFLGFDPEVYTKKAVGPDWNPGGKLIKTKAENLAPKGYGYLAFNLKNPLFTDKKVRLALAHLVNRQLMIEKFLYGMSLPATGPWYQQSKYASKNVKPIAFDPARAISLLKEAGWSDTDKNGIVDKMINGQKKELSFTLLTANPDFEKYATVFREDAKKAGVVVNIKQMEWNSFVKLTDEGNFEMVNLAWGGGSVDLDPKQIWHSSSAGPGGSNFAQYKVPEVDKLIDAARQEMDTAKRIPMMQKIYERIADDVPYIFLFNGKYVLYGQTARMKKPKDTLGYSVGVSRWWVEK
jgi:microcin C transport system substrate-binding protein